MQHRRLLATAAACVVVPALAGCSREPQPRTVTVVDSTMELDMPSCSAEYATDVQETGEAVHVELRQISPGDEDAECADSVIVELQEPLGQRTVTINRDGVRVRTPDRSPGSG